MPRRWASPLCNEKRTRIEPAHFDRGAAGLAIALGEMRVADREQRAVDKHRQHQPRPFAQLLDVEIAAVLARRDRAQRLGRDRLAARHRALGFGRQRHAAARGEFGFPALDGLAQFLRRGDADDPDKRAVGDAHTGQIGRLGKAVLDRPFGDVAGRGRRRAKSRNPAPARCSQTPPASCRRSRLRADRPGRPRRHRPARSAAWTQVEIAVQQILARSSTAVIWPSKASRVWISTSSPSCGLDHRRDRLVPAVVALLRLLGEPLPVIDGDAFHAAPPAPSAGEAMHNPCPRQAAVPRRCVSR